MAYQCFKLALAANNDHAEAYNNLGVLEWKMGRGEEVCVCVCVEVWGVQKELRVETGICQCVALSSPLGYHSTYSSICNTL